MQAYRTCTAGGATSLNGLPKWHYTNLSVCLYENLNSTMKENLTGQLSVNTPLVSCIVNSEKHPASGIVSNPLPGNNWSCFRVDRIFPSVCSYVTSSSSPSLPSASSTFISVYFFFLLLLGMIKHTLESVHTSSFNMFIFCYLFHSGIKKKFQHVLIVESRFLLWPHKSLYKKLWA